MAEAEHLTAGSAGIKIGVHFIRRLRSNAYWTNLGNVQIFNMINCARGAVDVRCDAARGGPSCSGESHLDGITGGAVGPVT